MICKLKEVLRLSGGGWQVTFTAGENPKLEGLNDQLLRVDVKKASKKRSLTSNAFLWALCQQVGDALKPPIPKEEVYKKAIRDVGEFEPLPIKNEAVETFQKRWSEKGIGWFAEIVDDSKLKGYKLVFAYYGSSTYDSQRMNKLIEYVLDEADQLGLKIPIGKEKEEMFRGWGLC